MRELCHRLPVPTAPRAELLVCFFTHAKQAAYNTCTNTNHNRCIYRMPFTDVRLAWCGAAFTSSGHPPAVVQSHAPDDAVMSEEPVSAPAVGDAPHAERAVARGRHHRVALHLDTGDLALRAQPAHQPAAGRRPHLARQAGRSEEVPCAVSSAGAPLDRGGSAGDGEVRITRRNTRRNQCARCYAYCLVFLDPEKQRRKTGLLHFPRLYQLS